MAIKQLLLGCGTNHQKKLFLQGQSQEWDDLTTLDINQELHPDVVWDLNNLYLPFENESFDEIHAYEVLEHVGKQGDYEFFFGQFGDFWRILKPNGYIFITVPHWTSMWAWGDPGHTRVLPEGVFVFLDQEEYQKQVGKSPMTDYRFILKCDFKRHVVVEQDGILYVILQKR